MYSFLLTSNGMSHARFGMQYIFFTVMRKPIIQGPLLSPWLSVLLWASTVSFYEWGWSLVSPSIEFIIERFIISIVCFWKEIIGSDGFCLWFYSDCSCKNKSRIKDYDYIKVGWVRGKEWGNDKLFFLQVFIVSFKISFKLLSSSFR